MASIDRNIEEILNNLDPITEFSRNTTLSYF